jgi:hypothetical protein
MINPKEFVKVLVRAANSDAADNKPKRDGDTEQRYCTTRLLLSVTDMISSRESELENKEL